MKKTLTLLSLIILTSGCASLTQPTAVDTHKPESSTQETIQRESMFGNWVGKATLKNGGSREWLIQRGVDGTFLVSFAIAEPGEELALSQEVGFWGVSGPIYFTITKGWIKADGTIEPADPTKAYFYDAYEILSVTSEQFRYQHFSTKNLFQVTKVSDDFTPKMLVEQFGSNP